MVSVIYAVVYGVTTISAVLLALFVLSLTSNFYHSERYDFEFYLVLPCLILIVVPPYIGWTSFMPRWELGDKPKTDRQGVFGDMLLMFAFVLLAASTARHLLIGD
jgi:hypothetical protein